MTALGPIRLLRSYAICPACEQGGFPVDPLLGINGWLTPRALRMACTAGVADPFRKAEFLLRELAGWTVDADTLRRRCHEQAAQAQVDKPDRQALPEAFQESDDKYELHIDAGKINTVEYGWRDVKVGTFVCRPCGPSSDSTDFAQRNLPKPTLRSVVAAIEESVDFGMRVEEEALRLGVPLSERLSVLGDGAGWIWTLSSDHFFGAFEVLDFWHASEKLAKAGRAVLSPGEEFESWFATAKGRLAGDGYLGVVESLGALSTRECLSEEGGRVLGEVLNYFASHKDRLNYGLRLHRGETIGSGVVEGTIKQLVNIRMKRTGARWCIAHVSPFVEFRAMSDGVEWNEHWARLAA